MSLDDLIARLEAGRHGGACFDNAIRETLGLPPRCCRGTFDTRTGEILTEELSAECYSTSIDAALMLVPEGFAVDYLLVWPKAPSRAVVLGTHKERDGLYWRNGNEGRWEANGATPALAICIAALKARAGQ